MQHPAHGLGWLWRSRAWSVALVGVIALLVRLVVVWVVPLADRGDLVGWEETAQRVTLAGIQRGYASLDPGSLYPPAFFYPLWLTGKVYVACCSPEFALGTRSLDLLMRLGPVIVDALLACLVWALARTWSPGPGAGRAGLLYAVCPAVLVTVGQRGMIGDPYVAALVVVAVLAVQRGWSVAAAASATLAVLTKPQALALAPLLMFLVLRRASVRQRVAAAAASALVTLAVLLPFIAYGALPEVLAAVRAMAGLHANTQNSADNLWTLLPVWRLAGSAVGPFGEVPDETPAFAGVSYRDAGIAAFAILQVFTLARLWRGATPPQVAQAAAVLSLGFFFINTRMHVNYVFLTFPFLCALAGTNGLATRLVLAGVTLACVLDWQDTLPWAIHRANAALYAASFAALCVLGPARVLLEAARGRRAARLPRRLPVQTALSPTEVTVVPERPAA